jgi:hypothetical protein
MTQGAGANWSSEEPEGAEPSAAHPARHIAFWDFIAP